MRVGASGPNLPFTKSDAVAMQYLESGRCGNVAIRPEDSENPQSFLTRLGKLHIVTMRLVRCNCRLNGEFGHAKFVTVFKLWAFETIIPFRDVRFDETIRNRQSR
jgi:hypothetical protein